MPAHECEGCTEYREVSRRQFIGVAGGTALAVSTVPAWLPRVVYAQDHCSDRDVIVSLYLRGGCDGLTICVPHAEDAYYDCRPTLAIPRPDSGEPGAAIDLDGFFGFPESMGTLMTPWNAGHLSVIQATGSTDPSKSHFDAQRFMEIGKPGNNELFTGWLGRHLMTSTPFSKDAVLRAVGINYGLQRQLWGGPLTLPVPDMANFGLSGNGGTEDERRLVLSDIYAEVPDPLRSSAQNTQATIDLLETIDFQNYQPAGGAEYPNTGLGYAFKSTAALIKAQVGAEAIAIDRGGWDTHNQQGSIGGAMENLMSDLSRSLSAFHTDIFTDTTNVTVVAMSEFGRNIDENGSEGTDHGHGNLMMLMGDNIAGGQVITKWPGLDPEDRYQERDLQVTIDFRDVLAEIVERRLGNTNTDFIFPDYTPTFQGVTLNCPSAGT